MTFLPALCCVGTLAEKVLYITKVTVQEEECCVCQA